MEAAAEARAAAGLTRRLRPRPAREGVLDLAGNDYLGMSRHPVVVRAAADAAAHWGAGATGSRLVSGSTSLHAQLEEELADFYGTEAALVFSSGYAANIAMVASLGGAGTVLACDRYNHASLIDATRLAKAAGGHVRLFGHRDTEEAAARLSEATLPHRLVISDTVFSVDGDIADVAGLARVCRAHGAALLIDDAHGLGVIGEAGNGSLRSAGLANAGDVVTSVTLSKALGAQGGAILGPRRVIDHMVQTARTFIFDTGLAPAAVGGALAALRLLRAEPERAQRVRAIARHLSASLNAAGLRASTPDAAVVSVLASSPDAAVTWAQRCCTAGVRVGCFRPPSVPDGRARLRLTARADLTDADVERALEIVVEHS
ncbi:8-amino-7-oxononanoate synthase [Salinactinospora qingdaonensis]|uniref:8-amino-7-oxononanoate synthase n=1 Tax=Salinactinospora qingdaonensis TaxID=702744 RepID=A0ABP7EY93_9ACTN